MFKEKEPKMSDYDKHMEIISNTLRNGEELITLFTGNLNAWAQVKDQLPNHCFAVTNKRIILNQLPIKANTHGRMDTYSFKSILSVGKGMSYILKLPILTVKTFVGSIEISGNDPELDVAYNYLVDILLDRER